MDNTESDHHKPPSAGLIKRFFNSLKPNHFVELDTKEALLSVLRQAKEGGLIDEDRLGIMSGALNMGEQTAEDVMVTRDRMVCLDLEEGFDQWVSCIVKSGHSRFPVYEGDDDNILGILLAKDLLRYLKEGQTKPNKEQLRSLIRACTFVVPESKKIDKLLKEFRQARSHIALVVDEFGILKGLLTMEDILEELVGDIEDEYDPIEQAQIFKINETSWRVNALLSIEETNQLLNIELDNEECDTLGGWVADELDHVPRVGDIVEFEGYTFSILKANDRRAIWVKIEKTDE